MRVGFKRCYGNGAYYEIISVVRPDAESKSYSGGRKVSKSLTYMKRVRDDAEYILVLRLYFARLILRLRNDRVNKELLDR